MTSPALTDKATGSVLDWVGKYGIATVFAVILLLFVLLSVYQTQAEILRTQADISRTLDRINTRLEAIERQK